MQTGNPSHSGLPDDSLPARDLVRPCLAVHDLRIEPSRIHYLKFILEGYDGLAMLSTIDPRQGIVRVRFPVEVKHEVFALLRDLAPRVGGIDWLNVIHE
jgi:hypothetical protein